MKNAALILILMTFFFQSCEKWSDYRYKYTGKWQFDVSYTHEVFGPVNGIKIFHDTTTTTFHKGEISLGSSGTALVFNSTSYIKEFQVDRDGKIIPVNDMGWNYEEYGGFEGRKIFRYFYSHRPGAQYHGKTSTGINGRKD